MTESEPEMAFLTAAFAFLVPLILTPRILFYYDITPKVTLLLLAAALAAALLGWQWNSWARFASGRGGRLYLLAAGTTIAAAVVAALHSADPELAWYGSNWRRMGALVLSATVLAALWVAQAALGSAQRLLVLMRAICGAGLLASLFGIAQYFGWDPILPRDAYSVGEGIFQIVRPPGTLGHSDYFAAFLLWPFFVAMAAAGAEKSRYGRWFAMASACSSGIAILLSGSRGAMLGLAAGAAVRMWLKPPKVRSLTAASLACCVVLAGFYISPAGERLRARVHWIDEDRFGGARFLLWRDSAAMSEQRLLVGFGPDAFAAEFPKFESAKLARAFPDFFHESPHNLFWDVLTGEGLLGVMALGGVVLIAGYAGVRARKRDPLTVAAFLPGLAAALVAHQFAVWTATGAFYFYLGAAALAASEEGGSHQGTAAAWRIPMGWRAVLTGAGIGVGVLLGVYAWRLTAQDAGLAKVVRRMDAGDLSGAAEAYRDTLRLPDAGVSADLFLSRRWFKEAAGTRSAIAKIYYGQVAAGAASRATHYPEQSANAWYNLSVLAAARNDAAGTEYALRQAAAAAPAWYKPHWMLARLLAGGNRGAEAAQEAAREAAQALELNGGKDGEVASTLAAIACGRGSPCSTGRRR